MSNNTDQPETASYEILEEVSRGGQGVVYRARHRDTSRIVALKVHREPVGGNARDRLERELEAASLLDHPGIVEVFGTESTVDGPAIAMQWIDGISIDSWAAERGTGRDALRDKVEMFVAVCDAVRHAHQRGVLHRDLKPSNILVDSEHQPKVVDFGVALLLADPGEGSGPKDSDAEPGIVDLIGTPSFLAPEVLLQEIGSPDLRSDVYALGAVLSVVLTGRAPYGDHRDLAAMIHAVQTTEPDHASRSGAGIDPELDHVLSTALAREPASRYQSVDALADDLRRYLNGEPVHAHPPSAWYRLRKTVRRHPVAAGIAVVVAALAPTFAVTSALHTSRLEAATIATQEARDNAERRAEDLTRKVDEFRFLAYSAVLPYAEGTAYRFFPGVPAQLVEHDRWLSEMGEPLGAALPRALAERDELRARAMEYTDADRVLDHNGHPGFDELEVVEWLRRELASSLEGVAADDPHTSNWRTLLAQCEERSTELRGDVGLRRTYRFESRREALRHDVLTRLVTGLDKFTAPDGMLPRMREQREWAAHIDEVSIERPEWQRAIAAIEKSPAYGGLRIKPQRGIVPLEPDPDTGLWEFLHLRSGAAEGGAPTRREDGRLAVTDATGVVLVLLPGGEFWMGAQKDDPKKPNYDPRAVEREGPVHRVRLHPFFIGKYEITQAQWRRMSFGGEPSVLASGPTHPVNSVGWGDCLKVMGMSGLRIPTEAQWEYACRAGTTTPFSSGATPQSLFGHANAAERQLATDNGYTGSAPAGSFAPNGFGLHDMEGNVNEWCVDWFVLYSTPVRAMDGLRTERDANPRLQTWRTGRGGYHGTPLAEMRAAARQTAHRAAKGPSLGLRAAHPVYR